jgi:hypothetical protein
VERVNLLEHAAPAHDATAATKNFGDVAFRPLLSGGSHGPCNTGKDARQSERGGGGSVSDAVN